MGELLERLKKLDIQMKETDGVVLREPSERDAELVAELYKDSFAEHILVKWGVLSSPEEMKKQFREENKRWVIAEKDGRVVGASTIEVSEWNKAADLERVVVAKDMRGNGIATKMGEMLLDIAETTGIKYVFAHTRGPEYGAQKAMSKLGFKVGGIMPVFYVNHDGREVRENFVYMHRFLNGGESEVESYDNLIPEAKRLKECMEGMHSK